ncbi:MAG: flagellar FlbD family protein [Planctomycetota bacterium]|jgi:flagellar protein FlbD
MIKLTRLSGPEFIVNAELIKFVEETPDTILTLRDGEKLLVTESADEVVNRVIGYARTIRLIGELDR